MDDTPLVGTAVNKTFVCDLCHEETWTLFPWKHTYQVCSSCYDYGLWYDGLTRDERIAEEQSMARYTHHEIEHSDCNCQHRYPPREVTP